MKLSPAAISKAVDIWKTLLANPKYDNLGDTGTPDERRTMGFASALTAMISKNNTPDVLDRFGEELAKALAAVDVPGNYYWLDVDYQPCQMLADAAKSAGLKMEWPWKTTTWIKADSVELRAGYGAPIQTFELDEPTTDLAERAKGKP